MSNYLAALIVSKTFRMRWRNYMQSLSQNETIIVNLASASIKKNNKYTSHHINKKKCSTSNEMILVKCKRLGLTGD